MVFPAHASFAVHRLHPRGGSAHRDSGRLGRQYVFPERNRFGAGTASAGRPQPDVHHVALCEGPESGLRRRHRKRRAGNARRRSGRPPDIAGSRVRLHPDTGRQDRKLYARAVGSRHPNHSGEIVRGAARPAACRIGRCGTVESLPRFEEQPGLLSGETRGQRPHRRRRRTHPLSGVVAAGHRLRGSRSRRHHRRQRPGHRAPAEGLGRGVAGHFGRERRRGDDPRQDRGGSVLLARLPRQHDRRLCGRAGNRLGRDGAAAHHRVAAPSEHRQSNGDDYRGGVVLYRRAAELVDRTVSHPPGTPRGRHRRGRAGWQRRSFRPRIPWRGTARNPPPGTRVQHHARRFAAQGGRDVAGVAPGRNVQPDQDPIPGQYEPRNPHPAQRRGRDDRVDAPDRHVGGAALLHGAGVAVEPGAAAFGGRHPRSVAHRSRTAGT